MTDNGIKNQSLRSWVGPSAPASQDPLHDVLSWVAIPVAAKFVNSKIYE